MNFLFNTALRGLHICGILPTLGASVITTADIGKYAHSDGQITDDNFNLL